MDRFESMRAFVNVVDNGGFAAAARKVGMSRSAVNKHVHSLEDRLGAQLLTRQHAQGDADRNRLCVLRAMRRNIGRIGGGRGRRLGAS